MPIMTAMTPTLRTRSAHFDPDLSRFCDRFTRDERTPLLSVLADARVAGLLRDDVSDDDAVSLLMGPLFLRTLMTREPVDDAWVRGHAERVHRAVVRQPLVSAD
jgi:hypothetical protein